MLNQTFDKYEVVVADSGDMSVESVVEAARKQTDVPIKYIHFPHKDNYTLAEARNRAIIEAEGEWLLLCDDRIKIQPDVLGIFSRRKSPKLWFWGEKDGVAKSFVENFSYVNRKELITQGMFCERIQSYGGMTQDIRSRFREELGFTFGFVADAKATGIKRAKSKKSRRENIIQAKWLLSKMHD